MRPGEVVAGRYRVGDPLGRGGMGEVFRATDELLGREVALKLLLPARREPEMAERFHREARAAAALSDPHVVAAFDFGPYEDGFFLAMELVEGRTVAVELRLRGPFGADRALAVIRQSAAGLAAAHRNDIVHRDVKPQNLLITADGTVKVSDFGIARFLTDTTTTLTATGQILGSIHYLAPERAQGLPAGKASDVYALGCVLYQLVTGHPPFQGDQPASVMYQHVTTEPTPPSDLRPQLAGPFEELLLSMLAKDPADRPTAGEVAATATSLSGVTARLTDGSARLTGGAARLTGGSARQTGGAARRTGGSGAVPAVGSNRAEDRSTGRRTDDGSAVAASRLRESARWSRRRLIGAGAALAVLAGVGTAVVLDHRDQRLPETTYLTPPSTPRTTPTVPPTTRPTVSTTTITTERKASTTGRPTVVAPRPPEPPGHTKPGKPGKPGQGKSKGKNPKKP
ncbi:serine/threonine-protein kinase [Kribbella sp. NPDC051770]|uniref:serine/threonine-protein kinase n=1 Tax=Kribbella sp. NPDC051770 TaxID=3155413 RepID=UPI003448EE37